MNHYYLQRARAAHAAADAATDPRDKAAFLGAARTWELLAKPRESAFSYEPLRRDLEALKADCASCGADTAQECAANDCDKLPAQRKSPARYVHGERPSPWDAPVRQTIEF